MPDSIITIAADGRLSFIWDDALGDLRQLGAVSIRRVSHVEPTAGGQWTADLSPVKGPMLGPFPLQQQALDAERTWLEQFCPLTTNR